MNGVTLYHPKGTKSQFLKVVNYNAKQVGQVLKLGFMGLHNGYTLELDDKIVSTKLLCL
jgi:hypothetical protein